MPECTCPTGFLATTLTGHADECPTRSGIERLEAAVAPLARRLADHPVYGSLTTLPALRTFMEHHVTAVWDFMSLLTVLQRELTCVTLPWRPRLDEALVHYVNEVKAAEESDVTPYGVGSHFEWYRRAMREVGADTAPIDALMARVSARGNLEPLAVSMTVARIPTSAASFTNATMTVVRRGRLPEVAGAFAYGRERMIPAMFAPMIEQVGDSAPLFSAYLARHVELDGDEHGPGARHLVESVCESEADWLAATAAALASLSERASLWDSLHHRITTRSAA